MAKPEHLLARLSAGGAIDILTKTWKQEDDDRPLIFGDYQTAGLIDRGGMSEVYEARRADGRFDRSVAIKVMLGTLFDAEAYRRFRREVNFLARLNHPNIAQLYDAGITERRQPYIVMELVRGERIDTFHLRRRLTLQEKIQHLLQLADALALAHAQLVIHRDIKPTNVLVTEDGVPKLLDFGIAKRLAESRAETTANPMTPAYASPEQLLGLPVTVASDVFQLARLFTTCFPQYRGDASATDSTEEDRQTLQALHREDIPPSCARVVEHLPPDLGAVIRKALSPDPADRYLSAQNFAADLRGYLAGFPVQARRNSTVRRGLKFLRRNAIPAGAAGLAIASLISFTGLSLWQQRVAEAARQEAERATAQAQRERDRADEVAAFLAGLFDAAKPRQTLGETVSATDLLDLGVRQLEASDEAPELQADLLETIAGVYQNLGETAEGLRLAERAVELKEAAYGPDSVDMASALSVLSRLYNETGDSAKAVAAVERAFAIQVEQLGYLHDDTLATLNNVAWINQFGGNLAEAERIQKEAVRYRRELHGNDHEQVTMALANTAVILREAGKYAEALDYFAEVFYWNERQLPDGHPFLAHDWYNYGLTLKRMGRTDQAETALRRALEMQLKVLGDRHPYTVMTMYTLAHLFQQNGRLDEAIALHQDSIAAAEAAFERPHVRLALGQLYYADALIHQRRLDEATLYLEDAGTQLQALNGVEYHKLLGDLYRARWLRARGDVAAAGRLLERLATRFESEPRMSRPELFEVYADMAEIQNQSGNSEAARVWLERGITLAQRLAGQDSIQVSRLAEKLGRPVRLGAGPGF